MVNLQRRGPYHSEPPTAPGGEPRKRPAKSSQRRTRKPTAEGTKTLPWKEWLSVWVQTGRSLEEFWNCSPAQAAIVFESGGMMKKKAQGSDIKNFARAMGMNVGG
jgi:hypothetical protein